MTANFHLIKTTTNKPLGDEALLSEYGSMSVSASKFSGGNANSVYYTGSYPGYVRAMGT